jgi:hypothetical protein
MGPDHGKPGNGLLLFFRVDDFDMALPEGTCARLSPRGGAPPEPQHRNHGILAPRPGRVLRYDQCGFLRPSYSLNRTARRRCLRAVRLWPTSLVSLSSCES